MMTERKSWRGQLNKKVTPEIKAEMKILREKGWFYREIGDKFNVTEDTVRYHLNPKCKEMVFFHSRKSHKKHGSPSKRNPEKTKSYIREYMRERRRNDPEFRERQNKAHREYYARKKSLHNKDNIKGE